MYTIKNTDTFSPELFPLVANELDNLTERMSHLSAFNKSGIIISFLKDHSLPHVPAKEQNETPSQTSSTKLVTTHIEMLFAACSSKPRFLTSFEEFISRRLNEAV